jgi:hypothetical protein
VPSVDDDQLAALRRLRAAFGLIEVVEVLSNDPGDDLAAAPADWFEAGHDQSREPKRAAQKESAKPLVTLGSFQGR